MGNEETKLGEKVNKMKIGIQESELDKKSLEMLGECEISAGLEGVAVMFQSQSFYLNETEANALIEFGKDNKFLLSDYFIVVLKHSHRVCAFYPNRYHTEEQVEEIGAEGKGE
jgi:hypothetical protein